MSEYLSDRKKKNSLEWSTVIISIDLKISRENIQKDPRKQTRSTRWLAVVLFVALLLTGLYLA